MRAGSPGPMRRGVARGTALVLPLLTLVSCGEKKPYFVLPHATPPAPTTSPAFFISAACDEPARRVLVRTSGRVRAYGPLKVAAFDPDAKKKVEKSNAQDDCQSEGFCTLNVQQGGALEVGVGKLEKAGSEWGFLCFCEGEACATDCQKPEARLDVRVTCPESRFATQQVLGVPSSPLPAHLPVDVTCTRTPPTVTCEPRILTLEEGVAHVYGALTSPGGPQRLKKLQAVPLAPAPGAPGKESQAFICLDAACSNPAYYLALNVKFEGWGGAAPDGGSTPDGGVMPGGAAPDGGAATDGGGR